MGFIFFPNENQINKYEMNSSEIVQYLLESAYSLSFTWVLIFSPIHITILSITLLNTQISILVSHELPLRVESLLKTASGYLRDAGVT